MHSSTIQCKSSDHRTELQPLKNTDLLYNLVSKNNSETIDELPKPSIVIDGYLVINNVV